MSFIRSTCYGGLWCAAVLSCVTCTRPAIKDERPAVWPAVTNETKPWSRWWWHGSAVTKEGITAEMEAYQQAGIGGLEITPIYGTYGEEDEFVDYLSGEWVDLFMHVLSEAERLDMGIDMATGTGWPFGGPWIGEDDACKNMQFAVYDVRGGDQLIQKVRMVQEPYLRALGTRVASEGESGMESASPGIDDLVDPISENKNLQGLAIEQVQFPKPLTLRGLMAYGENGQMFDLTARVDSAGTLDWTAPPGNWKLYAVFMGLHGKLVERAGPGGEGNVIDHFSAPALKNYLRRFDEAFSGRDITTLRAFFNDSYEVDDAKGAADFTPDLFSEFEKRRGYDLRRELPALMGQDTDEKNRRVLCDYRETLSELLLENFTQPWKAWAQGHHAIVRNQAHGSPANILDLYAAVDIPEIEGTEPLRFKMATSSANVSGKRLIAAEAATWLNEHFLSNLSDIKTALDQFMLQGVNHVVYHGTCYSPPDEPWPGRLFYAAVHLNPRNPMWKDFDKLNSYVTGCQSFLQRSRPDNDVLLYYPVYDRFSTPGNERIEHFDGIGTFEGSSFARSAEEMLASGYAFDFISDRQILETRVKGGRVVTSGNTVYKAIVVPRCDYMPLATLKQLSLLASSGATVVFLNGGPQRVSGYSNLDENAREFTATFQEMRGKVVSGNDLTSLLEEAGITRETMVDQDLQYIRKKDNDGDAVYFIRNSGERPYAGMVAPGRKMPSVMLFDPMTGMSGSARRRDDTDGSDVLVMLEPGQTLILEEYRSAVEVPEFPYPEVVGDPVPLSGRWTVTFNTGGPKLPPAYESDELSYWTDRPDGVYRDFSGTATYSLEFDRPRGPAKRWLLKFDSVKETAEVTLNGKPVGTLIGPVYSVVVEDSLLNNTNRLEVSVSNLMANRIAWMDRNHVFWKKFYNINFPARRRENSKDNIFTAAHWTPLPSGISGKVQWQALR